MKATFSIKIGVLVRFKNERFIIIEIRGLKEALCRRLSNNETVLIPVHDLVPDIEQNLVPKKNNKAIDLGAIPNEIWKPASEQHALIKELSELGRYNRSKKDIAIVANKLNKSTQTIYRLLSKFENDESILTFIPKERADKGSTKLGDEVEAIIQESIQRLLLKREFGTYKDVYRDVRMTCKKRELNSPGITTIRDRFLKIAEKDRVASRQGKKVAKEKFSPIRGSFPGANRPLDVIQIDHTPADIIIVDEVYRKPIGRPTLTIAIDVYSRVLMGFNLWLEAPSAASVGLCLAHAMLPKETWLAERGINAEWRCFGKPRKIHTDNAKEFRGNVIGRACQSYGIDSEQRPKGSPNYGGHVERSFRSFMEVTHRIEGTTFSNTKSKYDYDSSKKAIFTLKEFEYWFTTYITKIYHQEFHDGIKTTPMARYEAGIGGEDGQLPMGVPEKFWDEKRLRLDFMPFIERTVQEYGVLLDHIYYYDDILRMRIHEKDPDKPKSARKFIFRRDPSDISIIYFWDPDLKTYFEIPYAHLGRPPVSLWEVKAATREQRAKGKAAVDENSIFEGIEEMREIELKAAALKKGARRNTQRRSEDEVRRKKITKLTQKVTPKEAQLKVQIMESTENVLMTKEDNIDLDDEIIAPFEDIDMRINHE